MPREKFQYKTDPLAHQAKYFETTRDKNVFGCLWEQGLGKTKAIIDQVGWLYSRGEIDGLFVVAPNGVHAQWVDDEIPKHLHESVQVKAHCYLSSKAKFQKAKKELQAVIDYTGLAVLVMSYDAMMTEQGRAAAKTFLTKRHCLYALDEAARIKNPQAKRTKRVLASSRHAPYLRTMTGTPVDNSPFDVYTQMKFLNCDYWKSNGFGSYGEFKSCFGVYKDATNPYTGRPFKLLVKYRQLPYLHSLLKPHTSRLLKVDVLDLPPKIYSRRYYQMTPAQKRLYEEFESGMAIVGDTIHEASLAIVRMMRQYQVICGYLPTDIENPRDSLELIDEKNPRLDCLFDAFEDYPGKKIIWCKWTKDVDLIMERAKKQKIKAVRYDGMTDEDERKKSLQAIREGDAELFVAKQTTAGEGLTIVEARTSFYYSNDWSLSKRLQSEDRNHRIGQDTSVNYVDIVCHGTIDMRVVHALQDKLDTATIVLGDPSKPWIGNDADSVSRFLDCVEEGPVDEWQPEDIESYREFMKSLS